MPPLQGIECLAQRRPFERRSLSPPMTQNPKP